MRCQGEEPAGKAGEMRELLPAPLARRLATVQGMIGAALDSAPPGPISLISLCAGDGRDVLGVLPGHPRCADVRGRLVELDPELAERARERAAAVAPASALSARKEPF